MAYVEPHCGEVNITKHSSLRKLDRAMRRGKVPDERQAIIDVALRSAEKRRGVYLNSCPERWLAVQRSTGVKVA